ncbi:MAG: SIMPL domain-containing protein, partial [Patescibacteria group bacterium]
QNQPCYTGYCPPSESRIIGYTESQTVEVKIRDLDLVGKVLANLGDTGVSNLYGPNFTIDDEEGVKAKARKSAIQNARTKANVLAKDLGVRIVRVVNFSESGGPIWYGKTMVGDAMMESAGAPVPNIPAGENEIVVDVSVTYEIR